MFDKKMGDFYCAKGQWRVVAILLAGIAALPISTQAGNLAGQLLVKRSAVFTSGGSAKPHPQLSNLMHDGQQTNGWQLWQLPDDADPAEVARQLNSLFADSSETIAEPNRPRLPQLNDGQDILDSPLSNPNLSALQQLNLADAWRTTVGDAAVVVAVIDDGIDLQHPGLRQKIWRNKDEVANDGVDNDGNGFVDDIHGWNFHDDNNNPGHQPNDSGHGTLVAGAIAGDYFDDSGDKVAIGSAPGVRIMPLRISHDSHSLLRALTYAANNRADIINISLGGILPSAAEREVIADLQDRGILLVAAAGNHHNNNDFRGIYPASYALPNILSVAAQDTTATITEWSQYGSSSVDIAAPGVDIISTARDGNYVNASGTSLAAGFASGVAALIKSRFSDEDYRGIKARLFVAATPTSPAFVTRSDSAINAAALTWPSQPTFVVHNLSSTAAGNLRDIQIELAAYFTGSQPPELINSTLHCANYSDGNTIAVELISQNNYTLNYRVAPTVRSGAADLRCQLSLTDDLAITTRRRFRITEPRQLSLNRPTQATFQTSDQEDYQHWVIDVPAGGSNLELFVRSEQNIDVLLRPAEAPRYVASLGLSAPGLPFLLTDSETSHSASNSGFERLRRSNAAPGTWHVVVLNQQQQRNTRYSIEVTAQGPTSSGRAATPANLDSSNATPGHSELSSNDGGGGVMCWLALLVALLLKHRSFNLYSVNLLKSRQHGTASAFAINQAAQPERP